MNRSLGGVFVPEGDLKGRPRGIMKSGHFQSVVGPSNPKPQTLNVTLK